MKFIFSNLLGLFLLLTLFLNPVDVFGAKMTNDDVIKLVKAGMTEDLIISVITKSETAFNTSADDIIILSKAGVSQRIISAMINPETDESKNILKKKGQLDENKINPEDVILLDDGKEKSMTYVIPEIQTEARALGFGGLVSYSVLKGDKAKMRIKNKTPFFLVSVQKNLQPSSYITLASLEIRKSESRAVVAGGGFMSLTVGIDPDRIIPIIFEKIEDQSRTAKDFILYKVTCKNELALGEYAVILTKERSTSGLLGVPANPCFDFGID